MSLTDVLMSEEVWLTCVTHALTTETEEVMGLLLGDIQQTNNGNVTAMIWGASPQMRSDRRKDRVETNPELLAAASAQAEKMTIAAGKTTRVIGWYHSHPHITVLPSHVDVRTQAMYQLLDPGFIGLIFSCYSEDSQKVGRIQVIAFQSLDGRQRYVKPANSNPIIEVESSLSTSGNVLLTLTSSLNDHPEEDTGDSRVAKAAKVGGKSSDFEGPTSYSDVSQFGRGKTKPNAIIPYNVVDSQNTTVDMDSVDLSDAMQEALHRSNLEVSGAEFSRKEVPLKVLPSRTLLKLETPLNSFSDMQRVLFEEEQSAYNQAISHSMCDGKIHPLSFIHHTSTYQASICKLMEYCLTPAINVLQDRLKENEIRLTMLTEEAKLLEVEANGRGTVDVSRNSPTVDPKDIPASSTPTAQRNGTAGRIKNAP